MKELQIMDMQKISLEILKQITDICEELNLSYFLTYGTLIGAVRHKGYIPWDDDVDIMMPRSDYDKLLDYLYANQKKIYPLKPFDYKRNSKYPYMIARISDDRYVIDMENEEDYGMGVFIDIYPIDGLGNDYAKVKSYAKKGDYLASLCYQATRKRLKVEITKSPIKKILKAPAFVVAKIIGKNYFQSKLAKLGGREDYETSKYVGCVTWLSGGEKDIFERKWLEEYIMCDFDKYQFRIPKYYDKLLTNKYGDYMKLPPEKERIGHHFYKVYKK